MLENIKSLYLSKLIFSFTQEKLKFKLIKYNKILQKKININIINYKLLSGKYTIFKKKGIGKTYNFSDNKLVFEGEYLNGEKNGKIKEYDEQNYLVFEGEYKNGLKNGKVKEYYCNNRKKFEGEYLNGLKNGYGIEYDNGIIFEGEYTNGVRNGKAKEYYNDKLIFDGEY